MVALGEFTKFQKELRPKPTIGSNLRQSLQNIGQKIVRILKPAR
jgi:hypothetical protein